MSGSAKESSGPSESSGSSAGSSSGSYDPPFPPDDSSSSSSSSCQCGWEVTDIILAPSAQDGTFTLENTGCGEITVTEFFHSISGTWTPPPPVTIPEGGSQVFEFDGGADIRGTFFTVVTDCGDPQTHDWPTT